MAINLLAKSRYFLLLFSVFSFLSIGYAQQWEQLNDVPFYRHHSNGFGHEGKAYVILGGYDQLSNEMYEYEPTTDTWTQMANFPGAERQLAIGDDWNGKYYYGFGGSNTEYFTDIWEFDPETMTFTELPSCPCEGRMHPAFIAHNDKIFMGSGSTGNGDLRDWWEYDMITQEWTQKEPIPGARRHHPFFFTIGDDVYVGGGHIFNWNRYNPETETWSEIDNLPAGRVAGTQFNHGDYGYILAGDNYLHVSIPDFETFMRYNASTREWEYLPELPFGSRWAPSSFVIDDTVYFFGGLAFDQLTGEELDDSSMWKFDLLSLDPPTSTSENTESNNPMVYPNPLNAAVLNIDPEWQNEIRQLSLINAVGQTVYSTNDLSGSKVNLALVNKGIYVLRAELKDDSVKTMKLVIE